MSEEYSNGYARGYEAGQQSVLKLAEQSAQQDRVRELECVIADLQAECKELMAQQQQEQESLEDLHNALQRIDTAAVGLPTFEVRHEGGLDAVTQNIVDAITALHTQPAQQEPSGWQKIECPICGDMAIATDIPAAQRTWVGLTDEEILDMADGCTAQFHDLLSFARAIEAAHGIKENT